MVSNKDMVDIFGQREPIMKDIILKIREKVRVNIYLKMEKYMMEISKMIDGMDKEN